MNAPTTAAQAPTPELLTRPLLAPLATFSVVNGVLALPTSWFAGALLGFVAGLPGVLIGLASPAVLAFALRTWVVEAIREDPGLVGEQRATLGLVLASTACGLNLVVVLMALACVVLA